MKITILRPGGNDQLLVKGLIPKEKRRGINDELIRRFPNVEQVSFYQYDPKNNLATLELAGGEFCGNATRSLAYLLLKRKRGEINMKVSGTKEILRAGVRRKNTAFAQMPVKRIEKLRNNLFRIDLEGITQLVCLDAVAKLNPEQLKLLALQILNKENLIYSVPAAGVMFIEEEKDLIKLKPIVWVRDIETILYETACASGTAAVGLWKAMQDKKERLKVKVLQPSGKIIEARINKKPFEVFIDGPIEVLYKGGEKT